MISTSISDETPSPSARYLDLINLHPLRPIRSDEELDRAVALVDELLNLQERTPNEADYLEVLGNLIERYENEAHPIPRGTDTEMLRFLIENKEVSQTEVARETKIADSTISAILSGKRAITRSQVGAFARYFHVDPGVFISV